MNSNTKYSIQHLRSLRYFSLTDVVEIQVALSRRGRRQCLAELILLVGGHRRASHFECLKIYLHHFSEQLVRFLSMQFFRVIGASWEMCLIWSGGMKHILWKNRAVSCALNFIFCMGMFDSVTQYRTTFRVNGNEAF